MGLTATVRMVSPPVMRGSETLLETSTLFKKWTRSVRWSALATSTKSMPLSVVEISSVARRSLVAVAISVHQHLQLAPGLGGQQRVLDFNLQFGRIIKRLQRHNHHVLHLDNSRQPLVQGLQHNKVDGGVEGAGVWSKDQLPQTAPELRQIDALSRRGQQHLTDHLVHMGLIVGLR